MIEKLTSIRARFDAKAPNSGSLLSEFDESDPRKLQHLSLEQQKKRAKELLHELQASTNSKKDRPKLADAQRTIAMQHGFSKWTELKAHIELLELSRKSLELNQPSALDGDHRALHIRCGSDIQHAMVIAGFTGDFLVFADPYVHGPVPETDTLEEFIEARAAYISYDNNPPYEVALKRLQEDYSSLEKARDYDAVYLWSENDTYDQLICAKLLDFFSDKLKRPPCIKMINVTSMPGVEKFVGIGQLPPVAMRVLWQEFEEVSESQYQSAVDAWKAIRSPTPTHLQRLVETGLPDMPVMKTALDRHLKQLPSSFNGLNLTENLTLKILDNKGSMSAAQLFNWYTNHFEPLPFMGDTGYWHTLDDLANAAQPAIGLVKNGKQSNQWQVSLTDIGNELLIGNRDWLSLNAVDRWVGGIHISTDAGKVLTV